MNDPTESVLENLADTGIPPVPTELDESVHERLNNWLLAAHLGDFVLSGIPWAMASFLEAVAGLITFSTAGKYPADRFDRTNQSKH